MTANVDKLFHIFQDTVTHFWRNTFLRKKGLKLGLRNFRRKVGNRITRFARLNQNGYNINLRELVVVLLNK